MVAVQLRNFLQAAVERQIAKPLMLHKRGSKNTRRHHRGHRPQARTGFFTGGRWHVFFYGNCVGHNFLNYKTGGTNGSPCAFATTDCVILPPITLMPPISAG